MATSTPGLASWFSAKSQCKRLDPTFGSSDMNDIIAVKVILGGCGDSAWWWHNATNQCYCQVMI